MRNMQIPNTPLEEFYLQRSLLASLGEQLATILKAAHLQALQEEVQHQIDLLSSDTLRILIVGGFNQGKSTINNALLGERIPPTDPVPTTALLTTPKWGTRERAILEFIDSPGWEDDDLVEATTLAASTVDVVLFAVGCDTLPSREEDLAIDRIRHAGRAMVLFLCNRIDRVVPDAQAFIRRRRIAHLKRFSEQGDRYIFFTDAKSALTSRLSGHREQFEQSGMQLVEDALYGVLLRQSWQEKLAHHARRLRLLVHRALELLPMKRQLAQTGSVAFQAHYMQIHGQLEQLKQVPPHLFVSLEDRRYQLKNEISTTLKKFYLDMAREIEARAQRYVPPQRYFTWDMFVGDARERLAKETMAFLTEEVQYEFEAWATATLQPILVNALHEIGQELMERTEEATHYLIQLWHSFVNEEASVFEKPEKSWKEAVDRMMRELPTRIPAIVIKKANYLWHPSMDIMQTMKLENIQALVRDKASFEQIKQAIGQQYSKMLLEPQRVKVIADTVDNFLREILVRLDHALDIEIQSIQQVVDAHLLEKRLQQTWTQSDKALALRSLEDELYALESMLAEQVSMKE